MPHTLQAAKYTTSTLSCSSIDKTAIRSDVLLGAVTMCSVLCKEGGAQAMTLLPDFHVTNPS